MRSLLASELHAFAAAVGAPAPTTHLLHWDGADLETQRVVLPGGTELMLVAGSLYPGVPPLALVYRAETGTEQVQLRWDVATPGHQRLAQALAGVFVAPGPFLPVWGLSPTELLTRDPQSGQLAGWTRFFSGREPQPDRFRAALRARSQGLLDERLAGATVLLIGAGSVGSYLAEQLTRSGVEHWRLVDHDAVEPANLCRTGYAVGDIGRPKVAALAGRLLNIHPGVDVHPVCRSLLDFTTEGLSTLFENVDLVLAATDDPRAQARINRFAFSAGLPALYVGLYAGAAAGEAVPVLPGTTPCYRCATGVRRELAAMNGGMPERAVDYGTGRLVAEPALACDIQHVASAGVKLALSLLTRAAQGHVAQFAPGVFSRDMHWLMLSTTPDYGIFPAIHAANPGRYAYESVWLTTRSHPECPVCGSPENRETVEAPSLRGLDAAALRSAIPHFAAAG